MEWAISLCGVLVLLAGLADVFFAVLHYDGAGFVSSRLYRGLFDAAEFLTRPLPPRYRAMGLSLAAPLMVPVTITVWISLIALGYAFLYHAGMSRETFAFSSGTEPSFADALYASGVSISTLGFGDVTPTSGLYKLLVVTESLIGFGILTLAITYVVGTYEVLQRIAVVSAGLLHQTHDAGHPWTILAPHFVDGRPRALEPHLMELHRGVVEIYEGMRRHPIVYYYHSRRAYRSLPYTLRTVGGMAGALRWGLPVGHEGARSPWLPTLLTGVESTISHVEERFLSDPLDPVPEPVSPGTFEAAMGGAGEPEDDGLRRFLAMERFMRGLVLLEVPPEPGEAYARYREWHPYAHRLRAFFEATARDLGYDLDELARDPGRRLF